MQGGEAVSIEMLNSPCDRCGKQSERLHPFRWAERITYRRRVIEKPWLCIVCLVIEKRKLWGLK